MFSGIYLNRFLKNFCNIMLAVSVLTLVGAPNCMAEKTVATKSTTVKTTATKTPAAKTPAKTAKATTGTININTASAEEISSALKGVGMKKAQAIVAYRKSHGNFKTIDQLKEVKGIGDGTLNKNRANIKL